MRIAYCTESLPPLVDGVTRTLTELVTTLRETAHEFMFLSSVKPDAGLAWRDRVYTVPSLPLLVYPYYRIGLPVARTLDPVLDRFAPDVMHVVTPSLLGWYGVKYAQRRDIPVLLYVGRLGREKNLLYLVEAVQLLERRNQPFKLVIVGHGQMRRALAARLPNAHFAGAVEGAELSRWYASADAFVFPSTAE